ncbi:hypothetical protein [Desulfatirhabdium butyrativorans]|uniref:hypothetical protein n=1 Tax=Desulfatirhabdium butyrativorans TaxID=340467 RepID=UPI0004132DBF|nr:hypothetical protein [Desulfatirhabdium butyrativorans]
MGTFTAQILVGNSHPYHDGIEPTHYLFLSENSRPAWMLTSQNVIPRDFDRHPPIPSPIVWIQTVENMLEDALLMIAYSIARNPEIQTMARSFTDMRHARRRELYDMFTEEQRHQLYQKCRQAENFPKLIISVFQHSTIRNQIAVLEQYRMDFEVCMVCYSKMQNGMNGQTEIWGAPPTTR